MAAMNTMFTSKQKAAAERIASFGAEQRRLKAAAASRRAAAATDEQPDRGTWARPEPSPSAVRRGRYLS
jgi:hypothetical protein